jgi:hypothetical protein
MMSERAKAGLVVLVFVLVVIWCVFRPVTVWGNGLNLMFVNFQSLAINSATHKVSDGPGTATFWNWALKDDGGEIVDGATNGETACAVIISGLLKMVQDEQEPLIGKVHSWNPNMIDDLRNHGWIKIVDPEEVKTPKPGDLVRWQGHMGICIGNFSCGRMAASHSSVKEPPCPVIHGLTLTNGQEPIALLRHSAMECKAAEIKHLDSLGVYSRKGLRFERFEDVLK